MHSDSTFSCACPQALSPGRKILRPFDAKRSALSHECCPSDSALQLPSSPHTPCTSPASPTPPRSGSQLRGPSSAKPLPFQQPDLFPRSGGVSAPCRRDLSVTRVSSFSPFPVPSTPVSPVPWVKFSLLRYLVWCGFYVLAGPQLRSQNRQLLHSCDGVGASRDVGALPARFPNHPELEEGRASPQAREWGPQLSPCTPGLCCPLGRKPHGSCLRVRQRLCLQPRRP